MIQDLHSHTYYSFCGKDRPEEIVEAAIRGGMELFGICDHNYGIGYAQKSVYDLPRDILPDDYGRNLVRYLDHMRLIREKYADRIQILCGIEVATQQHKRAPLPPSVDISMFDYCLIEHLDQLTGEEPSVAGGDLFAFAERCGCPTGVAHTDLFSFIRTIGEDPYRYFKRMAEQGIFWEMNVNYDRIHHYKEHPYVSEFFKNEEQQAIVRESGVRLSVGFDGHRVEDYAPERVVNACRSITAMGIQLAFEE